jgi:hypothetical protein
MINELYELAAVLDDMDAQLTDWHDEYLELPKVKKNFLITYDSQPLFNELKI